MHTINPETEGCQRVQYRGQLVLHDCVRWLDYNVLTITRGVACLPLRGLIRVEPGLHSVLYENQSAFLKPPPMAFQQLAPGFCQKGKHIGLVVWFAVFGPLLWYTRLLDVHPKAAWFPRCPVYTLPYIIEMPLAIIGAVDAMTLSAKSSWCSHIWITASLGKN